VQRPEPKDAPPGAEAPPRLERVPAQEAASVAVPAPRVQRPEPAAAAEFHLPQAAAAQPA